MILKLTLLALTTYLAGFLFFKPPKSTPPKPTLSTRTISPSKSNRHHPLNHSGAPQIDRTLAHLSALDSPAALQNFATQLNADPKHRHSKTLWSILLAKWSQLDPEGMITFLAEEKSANRPTHMEDLAWQAWGATDPRGAAAQAPNLNRESSQALFKGIAQVDPDLAIELAFQAPGSDQLIDTILRTSSDFSPETVAHLKQFIDVGWISSQARQLVSKSSFTGDPATDRAISKKYAGSKHLVADYFLANLANKQPEQAIALLENDPPSRERAVTTVEIANTWAQKDPEASLAWVRAQSSPQVKNSALVAIASVIGGQDPLRGLSLIDEINWAETKNLRDQKDIADGKVSHSNVYHQNQFETLPTATALFQNLASTDPAAAQKYLAENVPEKYRSRFQSLLKN